MIKGNGTLRARTSYPRKTWKSHESVFGTRSSDLQITSWRCVTLLAYRLTDWWMSLGIWWYVASWFQVTSLYGIPKYFAMYALQADSILIFSVSSGLNFFLLLISWKIKIQASHQNIIKVRPRALTWQQPFTYFENVREFMWIRLFGNYPRWQFTFIVLGDFHEWKWCLTLNSSKARTTIELKVCYQCPAVASWIHMTCPRIPIMMDSNWKAEE